MRVEALRGADLEAVIDDLARLRISVFRDWPYLYDGDLAYERAYLAPYRARIALRVAPIVVFTGMQLAIPLVARAAIDRALAGRPGADAVAVAAIARDFGQIIEDHANLQESELFPDLIERHDDSIRHKLGDHYARLPVHGTGLAMTGPVAA